MTTSRGSGPAVGEAAPDFTLPSTAGRGVTLSEYRGKAHVLLAFFPLAFTKVCAAEFCGFSEAVSAFDGANAVVLGISVDAIPSLQAFRAQEGITVELLSDFRREVCRVYGTLLEDAFLSRRAYFIVDRSGIVRWRHVERDLGDKRDNGELLRQLAALP